MRALVFVAVACAVFAGSAPAQPAPRAHPRPNVILIYADDMDCRQLACYGGKVATPNIDRLAAEGVKFTRFLPSSPVCTPSRYSLLTGNYASRCPGLDAAYPAGAPASLTWNTPFVPEDITIPRLLGQHGYATGMVGKWHNGLPTLTPVQSESDIADPVVAHHVAENYRKICDHIRSRTGFDYVDGIYGDNYEWLPIPKSLKFHNQDWMTQKALEFIERSARRPFFLYLAATLPHAPNPMASLKADPRATPAGLLDKAPQVQPAREDVLRRAVAAGFKEDDNRKGAWAGLAWLDDGVGAILRKLESLGLAGNTLVVFASDNSSHGKMTCYADPVPCVVRWPGVISPGEERSGLASNIDVAPTILEACGAAASGNTRFDGMSWLPLFRREAASWRDALFLEVTFTRGVVMDGWKYIATRFPERIAANITPANRRDFNQEGARFSPGTQQHVRYGANRLFPGYYDDDQLYDLRNDPQQQLNLAGTSAHAARLADMKRRLGEYSRTLPRAFGEFKPRPAPHSGDPRGAP